MKIFKLPDLGEGLAEAEIREWYVKKGDTVKVDQPLVSMETAKAVVDVPSPYSGKILELHGAANDVIQTGAPLITFETDDDTKAEKGSVVGSLEESSKKLDEGEVIIGRAPSSTQTVKAMPAARVLAKEMQVDLAAITATGPQGLITVDDVKKFLNQKTQPAKSIGQGEALHGVRRVMANIMAEAHREVVATTIIEDADISHFKQGTDLTGRLIEAMIAGIKVEPALNAWFDGKAMERRLFSEINLGIAVDSDEGLFVPVIKQAEKKSADEIRQLIDQYKTAIKSRSIAASDMQGATISLSNFGTITGRYATPIIVPPMVAILACGRSREAAIPREGKVTVGRIMPLSLTFDHRAVTGGEASRFLGAVIQSLQK